MIKFEALPEDFANRIWNGGTDDYGLQPEKRISAGDGVPCRHCLNEIAEGEPYLVLACRPFPALQPYAETGPIFLHAERCERYQVDAGETELPLMLTSPDYIVRGYG